MNTHDISDDEGDVGEDEASIPNAAQLDSEEDVDFSNAAPRSMPNLKYNEKDPNTLYMVYNPSGGMTNQDMELESALHMAKLLSRTLYVPQFGRHTNLVTGYMGLSKQELFPADRILDFERMTQYARVIPLDVSVRYLTEKLYAREEVLRIQTDVGFQGDVQASRLQNNKAKLLYFSGHGMWHHWFPRKLMQQVKLSLFYTPYLRKLSMRIADTYLGPKFYAIHGRLGDQAYRWQGKSSLEFFVKTPEFAAWDKSLKVYLASDDPSNPFFDELRKRITVVSLPDLQGEEMDEFRKVFGTNLRFRNDMLSVLDKLLCIQSNGFLGSKFSTFSLEIRRNRAAVKYVFPELYAKRQTERGSI